MSPPKVKMWGLSTLAALKNREDLNASVCREDERVSETNEAAGRTRSIGKNRRVTPSSNWSGVERTTQNSCVLGRRGQIDDVLKHGQLWIGGRVYEGDWRKGKVCCKGKLLWPSGASYVGEFKNGKMEGFGTFVGSDGDTYTGYWIGDKKEGFGRRKYINGDYYEGMWRKNLQEGKGRYVWSNGDEYRGECRNGLVSGRGFLIKANGNKYEGEWEKGMMKWSRLVGAVDGGCGEGEEDLRLGNDDTEISLNFMGNNVRNKLPRNGGMRGTLVDKRHSSICIWDESGDTIDNSEVPESSVFDDDGTGVDTRSITKFRRNGKYVPNKVRKPGKTVLKGHKHYELMLNLQLGIRFSTGKYASFSRELKSSDFEQREKSIRFPPEGSKITPSHHSTDFLWKDYCPVVFRHLRDLLQVDPADYMLSICGDAALRELSSPGKSGSFFYLTQDDKYLIKTAKKAEVRVLVKMLPSYFQHMREYENTLVTKFFGAHCVTMGGHKTRFVVMGNLFCSELKIHRRFDLKGSSYGRSIEKRAAEVDETTTFKDLDLNYVFHLKNIWFQELNKQIELDCGFLEAERIMDYSLLIGVHFLDHNSGNLIELSNRNPLKRLGSNTPARAQRTGRYFDGDQSRMSCLSLLPGRELHDVVLYFGIIDILQDYDINKKLEHAYKSIQADPTSISAVDPKHYSKRFQEFILRIFVKDQRIDCGK